MGKALGRKLLGEVATIVTPDTILGWHRKLVAKKFDGSKQRGEPGRPAIHSTVEELIVRMASENKKWVYDKIAGALHNLGYAISDQTVGNVLKRHDIPPAPERRKTTSRLEFFRYGTYRRREPENAVLYRIIQENWATFVETAHQQGRSLPLSIHDEFTAFMDCGILARGFVRMFRGTCRENRLVAFLP